jgi:hypothetical protein
MMPTGRPERPRVHARAAFSQSRPALGTTPADWLQGLQEHAARAQGLGFGPDLATMSITDLWGLYRLLCRLALEP